jgi:hypothetical protein
MSKKEKFPKLIFVSIENEGFKDECLVIDESIETIENAKPEGTVAVYELKEIQKVKWSFQTTKVK